MCALLKYSPLFPEIYWHNPAYHQQQVIAGNIATGDGSGGTDQPGSFDIAAGNIWSYINIGYNIAT